MIHRELTQTLKQAAKQFKVVTILGPRQSGKTTLAQTTFKKYRYISLEDLDTRAHAQNDPREFLEFHKNDHGIILDEIQHVPTLLSYIQTYVDREKINGYFILTGSQNFLINEAITQTLAGRMAILTLMPLSLSELEKNDLLPKTVEACIYKGSYPQLYAQKTNIPLWYASYTLSYIERDVRQVTTINELTTFKLFLQMCAGRIGQQLNITALANDCGIPFRTVDRWLSLLQASYIIVLLQPYYKNYSKRLVKTPKLYFFDTGLACSLLGIESEEQVRTHYLKGGLVENLIIADLFKQYYNTARPPHVYFWRDNHGNEVDCIIEKGGMVFPIEIKAGQTVSSSYFSGLNFWNEIAKNDPAQSLVVYTGKEDQKRSLGNVFSWQTAGHIIKKIYT
jgi:predicted AAA+ superfamily ATPase